MTPDPTRSELSSHPTRGRGGQVELEIKLVAAAPDGPAPDPGAVAACAAEHGIELGEAEELEQRDSYLDDEAMRLGRAGVGLRIRRVGEDAVLCLKVRRGRQGATHQRDEFESAWTGPAPRCAADLPDEVRRRVEPLLFDGPLRTVVELHTHRIRWPQARRGDSRAEVCIDRVAVAEHGHQHGASFHEVEIERVGETSFEPWLELAGGLTARFGLEPARLDKLQRALSLGRILLEPLRPAALHPGMSLRQAGLRVFETHLRRVQRQEVKVLTRDSSRPVHKLRVACRRLRAALRTFAPAFTPSELAPARKAIQRTARAFGEVRDLDVLIEHLGNRRDAVPAMLLGAHDATLALLARRRRKHAARARQGLAAPERIAALGAWQRALEARWEHTRLDLSPRLEDTARRLLTEALDEVGRLAAGLHPESPADDVHALRLVLKQLRYTGESLTDAFEGRLDTVLDRCSELQTVLGEFNDAEVALQRLHTLGRERKRLDREQRLVVGVWLAGEEQRRRLAREQVDVALRRFDPATVRAGVHELLHDGRPWIGR